MSKSVRESVDMQNADTLGAGRKPVFVLMELGGVLVFFAQAAFVTKKAIERGIAEGVSTPLACSVSIALLLGVLAADLASGVVHWAADNWGSSSWPFVGAAFIRPFRHHHVDARAITTHDFLELNGNNFIVSVPVLWLASSAMDSREGALGLPAASFWLSLAIFSGFTNQFHCWAHMESPPRLVQVLQNWGLLLSRKEHHLHHKRPHDRNYCITTGWMNRPLAAISFFEIIEKVISSTTGVEPLHIQLLRGRNK